MQFLTYDLFRQNAEKNLAPDEDGKRTEHWKMSGLGGRWSYHSAAIELIARSGTTDPAKVLEMGTMGAQLVHGSHTIDLERNRGKIDLSYVHDARDMPWPIDDKRYEWFVALRVFHHLWPVQRECFNEARRVAHNVILLVPPFVSRKVLRDVPRTDAGITPAQIKEWNGGNLPRQWQRLRGYGYLYWISDQDSVVSRSIKEYAAYYLECSLATTKKFIRNAQGW